MRRLPYKSILSLLLLLPAYGTPAAPRKATPSSQQNESWFEDVTQKAGITSRHHTRRFDNPYAEIMQGYTKLGSAAAVADYDNDGFEDIFVTDSCTTCKNHLYHNNGNLTFTDVAEKA